MVRYDDDADDDRAFYLPYADEEVEGADIQGNILFGFNKPRQRLLALLVMDGGRFRTALRTLPLVSSVAVLKHRAKRKEDPAATAEWLQVALTFPGLQKTYPDRATELKSLFPDFAEGMVRRAGRLGGQPDEAAEHPLSAADAVLLLAADGDSALEGLEREILRRLDGSAQTVFPEARSAAREEFDEHFDPFGFLELGSQPGLFGHIEVDGRTRSITPRRTPIDRRQGMPGQALIPAGEVVLGYRRNGAARPIGPLAVPVWARNGSFLVARRFRLEVGTFHRFVHDTAKTHGVSPELVASRIVGRWPSGAPPLRAPFRDEPKLGKSHCDWNYFLHRRQVPGLPNVFPNRRECHGPRPGVELDPLGQLCPFSSHTRRMNPRDDVGSGAGLPVSTVESLGRRMVRRSFSFGPPRTSSFSSPHEDGEERGLMFLSYQASIERQFEEPYRLALDPDGIAAGSGVDLLLSSGRRHATLGRLTQGGPSLSVETDLRFSTPTGGLYGFVPSISFLRGP